MLIEKLDKVFVENGFNPLKLTSTTGNLIIISPTNIKKNEFIE